MRKRGLSAHTAVLGLLLAVLLVSGVYPLQELVADRNRLGGLRHRSDGLDRRITELRDRREALQTDPEVERIARADLGMVRPGERAFALVPSPTPAPAPPRRAAPAASKQAGADGRGALGRWWTTFVDAIMARR